MYAFEICRQYQRALNTGQLEAVLNLFAPGATITTPLVGTLDAIEYHKRLFRHTKESITRTLNVFEGLKGSRSLAFYQHHTWILHSGKTIEFTGMDVFEFTPDNKRLTSIHIIYDSLPVRTSLSKEQLASLTLQA
jgi:hypothetical protein